MNYHKPYLLTLDDVISVVKEYELHHLNLSDFLLKGLAKSVKLEAVPEAVLKNCFFSGFIITTDETGRYSAVDLRVNEGMLFAAATRLELLAMIEDHLHGYALEEQKERDRKAIQLEREKKRNG